MGQYMKLELSLELPHIRMLTGWSSASDVAKEKGSIAVDYGVSSSIIYTIMRDGSAKELGFQNQKGDVAAACLLDLVMRCHCAGDGTVASCDCLQVARQLICLVYPTPHYACTKYHFDLWTRLLIVDATFRGLCLLHGSIQRLGSGDIRGLQIVP